MSAFRDLVISDLQAPYQHHNALEFLCAVRRKYRTTRTICVGDEVDQHALSKFEPDPDGYSAGHELEQALVFLRRMYRHFPTVYVCESNHTARYLRRAFGAGLPKAFLRCYNEVFEAPQGWQWAQAWEFDSPTGLVRYEHGDCVGGASHTAAYRLPLANQCSTAFGHRHSCGGVTYLNTRRAMIWGMNVGCLIDKESYAFAYHKGPIGVSLGCGVVIEGVPQFVPMLLDSNNRWMGRL